MGLIKTFFDIRKTLSEALKDPEYFARDGKTYCGQYATACLQVAGYNLDPILIQSDQGLYYRRMFTDTTTMYSLVIGNQGKGVYVLSKKEAWIESKQEMVCVLSAKDRPYNHIAIIYPTIDIYREGMIFTVAQQGAHGGIMKIDDARSWGERHNDPRILFFVLEKLK